MITTFRENSDFDNYPISNKKKAEITENLLQFFMNGDCKINYRVHKMT